uniref:Uncharacterized protein n=1 Tax=Ditylenchus dipsaci TaxID=166011 RepID=A0A915DBV1_9BILA
MSFLSIHHPAMSEVVEHHKHNNQYNNHVDQEDHQVIHKQEHHQHLKMDIPSITTENNDEAEMKDEAELNKISAQLVDEILQPQLNGHHESSIQQIKTEFTHKSEDVAESQASLPQTPPTPPPTHESFNLETNQVDTTLDNDAESSISPSSVDFVKVEEMTSASSPEKLDLTSESPDQVHEQVNSGSTEAHAVEQSYHVEEPVDKPVENQVVEEAAKVTEEQEEVQASEETVHSPAEELVEKPAESQAAEQPVNTQVTEEPEVVESQMVEEPIVVEEHPVQETQPEVKAVEQEQPVAEPEVVEHHVEEETTVVVEPVPAAEMDHQVPEKTAEPEVIEPHVEEVTAAAVKHQEISAPMEGESHEKVPEKTSEPEIVEVQQQEQPPAVEKPAVSEPVVEEPVEDEPVHKLSIESMHAEPLVKDEPEPLKEELLNPHVVEQVKVPEVNPLPVDLAYEMTHVKITAQPIEAQNHPISEPAIVVSVPVEDAKNDQQEPILLVVEDTTKATEVIPPEQVAPALAQIQEQVNTAPPTASATPQVEVAQSTSALEESAQNTSGSSKNSTLPRRYLDAARKRCTIL